MLLQCGHNIEEALRRRKMQAVPPTGSFASLCMILSHSFRGKLRFHLLFDKINKSMQTYLSAWLTFTEMKIPLQLL